MKTKLFILTVVFFGVLSAGNLFAQNAETHKHNKECLIDDLSDDQKTKIEEIKLNSEKKITVLKADIKIKEAELKKLEISDNPSEKDIHKKIDEIAVLKANVHKENASKRIAVRNELTPEQRVKYDLNKSKHMHSKKGADQHHKKADCEHKGEHPDCKNK